MRPLCLLLSLAGLAAAQTPADKKKDAPALLSFVVLGQPVRKTYTIVGGRGGIDEVAAKPGEEPPSRVIYKAGESTGQSWLTLNVPSGVSEVKPGVPAVELHAYVEPPAGNPAAVTGPIIATVPITTPGMPQTSFLLKKDLKKNWLQELAVISLPDDAKAFPACSVRLLNAARVDAFFQIGEKKIQLPPGRSTNVPAPDTAINIAAAVRQGDSYFPAVNTARLLRGNDRLTVVVHDFDGEPEKGQAAPPVAGVLISQPLPEEPAPAPAPGAAAVH